MEKTDSVSRTRKRIIKLTHTWTIENFSFFLDETHILSPLFGAKDDPGTRWCLSLHPKGNEENSKDYISLYLHLRSSQLGEVPTKAVVSIRGAFLRALATRSFEEVRELKPLGVRGWNQFISRSSLLKPHCVYLPGDKLTLCCEVSYAMEVENIPSQESQNRREPTGVLSGLYETRILPDVVLLLNDKEFYAHRAVLAARSPYLSATLKWLARRDGTSRLYVDGITEDRLENLLRFMYTGEAGNPHDMQVLIEMIGDFISMHSTTSKMSNSKLSRRCVVQ